MLIDGRYFGCNQGKKEKINNMKSSETLSNYDTERPNPDSDHSETTWDDLASVPFNEAKEDESANSEADLRNAVERIDQLRISDNELIELMANWDKVEINQENLQEATARNGNPNARGRGLFFGSGNLPMSDESVYRHVGSSAIADLMTQGFVRNKREAAGALDIPGKRGFGTEGAIVYWYDGDSQKRDKADLVIQASKAAADRGYVTKDDIQGIWVTDRKTGHAVNLIDGQDHTGLEMASHKP